MPRRYAYGLQRISQTAGAATSYYLYDGGGTVRVLADGTGTVTDTFTYDAFGNLVARTGSTANDMLYRGEQFDAGVGFYYLRARWNRPASGQFVSADTWEGSDVESISHHRYVYAHSNPVALVDPSGHRTIEQAAIYGFITEPAWVSFVRGLAVTGFVIYGGAREQYPHRGKIQAQGRGFSNPGEGVTVGWEMEIPPPADLGLLLLMQLEIKLIDFKSSTLSSGGRESLTKGTAQKESAFARAARWISEGPSKLGYTQGKSFPGWGDLGTGLDAMRIDVDIVKGSAFVTP